MGNSNADDLRNPYRSPDNQNIRRFAGPWLSPVASVLGSLGAGFILNAFCPMPYIGHSVLSDTMLVSAIAVSGTLVAGGFIFLVRQHYSWKQRAIGTASASVVVVFLYSDPAFNMNASPIHTVATIIGYVVGCGLAAVAYRKCLYLVGFGSMLFWVVVAWILCANYSLVQLIGGKWGIGLWGAWKS